MISYQQHMIDLFQSLIVFAVLCLLGVVWYALIKKKYTSMRAKRSFKYRIVYIMAMIYLVLLGRIWVNGFLHILAVLSLFAAGLVVVNKETVMNLVGALIINWRNLFAEGDYIQVSHYEGYVVTLGFFYFGLQESGADKGDVASGKFIRIPNGMIITTPVINYSVNSGVVRSRVKIVLNNQANLDVVKKIMATAFKETIVKYFENYKQDRLLNKSSAQAPDIHISLQTEKPFGIVVKSYFYCYFKDESEIQSLYTEALINLFQQHDNITLILSAS
jgi:small-conductance mechanosensitive channel